MRVAYSIEVFLITVYTCFQVEEYTNLVVFLPYSIQYNSSTAVVL